MIRKNRQKIKQWQDNNKRTDGKERKKERKKERRLNEKR